MVYEYMLHLKHYKKFEKKWLFFRWTRGTGGRNSQKQNRKGRQRGIVARDTGRPDCMPGM